MAEEEANDVIEDAVIDAIKKCAPMTARQIAPRKVEEWGTGQIQFYLPGGSSGMQDVNASSSFGVVSGTVNNPRVIQFALKLNF